MAVALTSPGGLLQWEAERYPQPLLEERRVVSSWRILVLALGVLTTGAAGVGAWFALWPMTVVQTRIVADGPGFAGRAALAEAALRVGAGTGRSAMLDDHGDTLVIAVEDEEPSRAWQRARSIADTLLNLSIPSAEQSPRFSAAGGQPVGTRAALLADRGKLLSLAETTDSRAATVSASLTTLARDIAANAHPVPDRARGREILDKGATALADLQLQRIQLAGRYQDDYPAVVALDTQIRSLRSFLQDQAHQVDATSRSLSPDPATAALEAERDRLRAELSQLNDRRATIGADLAAIGRNLAKLAPDPPMSTRPEPVSFKPAPLLIEAATTMGSGPDHRLLYVSTIGAVGALLSLLAWFTPRRHRNVPSGSLLQHLQSALLPHAPNVSASAVFHPALGGPSIPMRVASPDPRTVHT